MYHTHRVAKHQILIHLSTPLKFHQKSAEAYLGSRIGHAVGHIADKTTHIAILDELRHALSDIIEEAHGVSQKVYRTQDLGCLADQFLSKKETRNSDNMIQVIDRLLGINTECQ